MRTLRIEPLTELPPGDPGAVSLSLSARSRLFALSLPERLERLQRAKPSRKRPASERWLKAWSGSAWEPVALPDDGQPIHFAEPLPGGELLVVGARASYRGPGDHDENARIYSASGERVRSFLLGDGISDVQATDNGQIWTGYFDEGVFGNRGWNTPIGESGLICWDMEGRRLFEYDAGRAGTDAICDVYALNVASNRDAWVYFYTEFALVRVRDQRSYTAYQCSVKGSHAFAVAGRYVLFGGDYDEPNRFRLYTLPAEKGGPLKRVETFRLANDEDGEPLVAPRAAGRGSALVVLAGRRVYWIEVGEIAGRLMRAG